MSNYEPKSLPEVTAIEVVDLRHINANRVGTYMNDAGEAPFVRCEGQRAKHIAKIWRVLPIGKVYRCHTPPVGLRFFDANSLVCEASICFKCENLFGYFLGKPISYCFDAQSTEGLELFLMIKAIIGDEVLGEG